ncbi:MAG: hypothetical protein V8S27_03455 [Lachnospiraceae bacterium]
MKEQHWIEDHRQILKEIRENHPEEAKKWMEKHLSRYQVDETDVRAKYPQFFK